MRQSCRESHWLRPPEDQPGKLRCRRDPCGRGSCGSSREHAPIAIKASGVPVVIAASFARIFYRNAINVGLPALEIGDDVEKIKAGDILSIDLSTGKIIDKTTGDTFQAPPLPGFIQDIAQAGGLINYVKESK